MSKKENKELHSILRKIRDEIIRNLTANKINHITSYNISSTNITKSFVITLPEVNPKLQENIVKVLGRNFGEDLNCGKSSNGKKVLISVSKKYFDTFTQEKKKEKTPILPDESSNSSVGRKTTEFGNFRNAVVAYIQSATGLVAGGKRSFYVLTNTNDAGIKNLDIRCSEFKIVERILSALEREENYFKRIVSYDKKKIIVSEKPLIGETVISRKNLLQFMERVEKESSQVKYSINARRNSSATIAATNLEEVSFEFVVDDFDQSLRLSKLLNQELKIRKQGKLLRISGTYEQFVKELAKKFLLGNEKVPTISTAPAPSVKAKVTVPEKMRRSASGKGLVYRESRDGYVSYVHMSTNYNDFNFLHFNRKVETRHVMEIVDSIQRHGVLSFVNVVITDCIDGVKQMYIVDGQHRFEAFRYLRIPVQYTIVEASNKKEIVRLIADLNKTSRRWSTRNFMTAWSSLKIVDYTEIDNALTSTKLPITLVLEVFSEKDRKVATKMFQDGDFEIVNVDKNKAILKDINSIKDQLPRSRELFSCVVGAMRKIGNYSIDRLMKVLASNKIRSIRDLSPGREKLVTEIVSEYRKLAA